MKLLRDTKPDTKFNLESITRDPILVPVLTDGFWATLRDTPAPALARTLGVLKTKTYPKPLDRISQLPPDRRLAVERNNVMQSIRYATEELGL